MPALSWSPIELATLLEMHANGCCTRDIGTAIGRTKNAVIGKLHRLGYCKPVGRADRWQSDRVATLKTMLDEGHSLGSIATRIAVSQAAIRSKIWRAQLAAPAAAQRPRIVNKPAKDEPSSLQLTILDLKATTCRWPYGEPGDLRYCGHDAPIERAYCDYHHDLAHCKGTYSERRADDELDKRIAA